MFSTIFARHQHQCFNGVYISYENLRYTLDKSAVKIDRRVLFPSAHVPACDFLSFFEIFFLKEGHCASRFCGIRQFFLGYFGYFNFERRYCGTLQTCGMRCFIIFDGILITDYSPSPSTYLFANYQ